MIEPVMAIITWGFGVVIVMAGAIAAAVVFNEMRGM